MSAAELKDEFLRQYYSYTTEGELATKRPLWSEPSRGTTDEEVARGFVYVNVTSDYETDVETLDPQARKAVDEETDRRFWEKTGLAPGTKIRAKGHQAHPLRRWCGAGRDCSRRSRFRGTSSR